MIQINIFNFHDYRQYLEARRRSAGTSEEFKSLRRWAKAVGKSPSYFSHVLKGRRNLTPKIAELIGQFLGLNLEERNFLIKLVRLNDSHNLNTQKETYQNLKRSPAYQHANFQDHNSHQYLSHWYYVAIREMVQMNGFQLDPVWIQTRLKFKVTLTEIRSALHFLIQNQFIQVCRGKVVPTQERIQCHREIQGLAIAEFHEQIMNLSVRAMLELERSERKHQAKTIALSQAAFERAREILNHAFDQVQNLAVSPENSGGKDVFQFSLSAFSLTCHGKAK